MWRRTGMLVGLLLVGMLVLTGATIAQEVSVFSNRDVLSHKYGFQIHGGGSLYAMNDVNDYRAAATHTTNAEEAEMGIAWGIAVLYRSHENFRWTMGFSQLGEDETVAGWLAGTPQSIVQQVKGSEIYIMGSYLIPLNERMHFHVGGGPTIVSGTLDRSATAGTSFFDAKGRSMGLRANLGFEWLITPAIGLNGQLGYRLAKVGKVIYEDRNNVEQTVYWGSQNREFTVDFSGAFVELGIRLYFQPATRWLDL